MKKLFLLLLLIPLWITRVEAQVVTTTPNLGMSKPCVPGDAGCDPLGHPNWGPIINSNFDILDARVPRVTPDRVAAKPSIPLVDEIVIVTDSNSATDCATAGGTTKVICQWTGSAWQAIGGGGGGGGSSAFNDLTSGSNTTAAMVVGTGASLAPAGSGSIQATLLGASTVTALSLCGAGQAARGINSPGTASGCFDVHASVLASAVAAASSWRTNLSLVPGTNIQAFDAQLSDIAGLTPTDNRIVGSNASNLIFYSLSNCPGQAIDYTASTHTFSCLSSVGTVTGSGTTNKGAVWSSSSALAAAQWYTEDGSGALFTGQLRVGTTGTNDLTHDYSAITGHKTIAYPNASGTAVYKDTIDILTNKTLDAEGTGNAITMPYEWDMDLCGTVGGVATLIWNDDPLSTAPTATAVTGTNRTTCVARFADSDGDYGVGISKYLPTGWTGALDAVVIWKTTGTGNARFQFQTKCYADDEADDAAFNTASVVTAAAGTSGRPNMQAITGITTTGCAATELMRIRFFRNRTEGSDTLNSTLDVEKVIFTYRVTR